MKYYAIREKVTRRFVSETDFSRVDGRPRQIFASPLHPPLLLAGEHLGSELRRRRIDMTLFDVVVVVVREANEK